MASAVVQELSKEMAYRALYLASDTQVDQAILDLLRSTCAEVHVVSAIAQATALIESPSHATNGSDSKYVIVADVVAGGTALAEYVVSRFGRLTQTQADLAMHSQPLIILIDASGDVNAARKAIRLRVNAYLLGSESTDDKVAMISRLLASSDPDEFIDVSGSASATPFTSTTSTSASSLSSYTATQAPHNDSDVLPSLDSHATRLSQIESAIITCLSTHVGLPMSASSIVSQVMGREMDEDKAASLIRPHISRLRSKVEPMPQMPQRLLTVRGKGYMFVC
jgi:DNA-binding response OmpR family regulator